MTLSRTTSSMFNASVVHVHRHASKGTNFTVREVWRENLSAEFALLRSCVVSHPIVSMDVEFPGVVARPINGPKDSQYETLRCNVDLLSPIQIAFSLSDRDGNLPVVDGAEVGAWQFNFKFSLTEDMFATESIDLLERAGVEFDYLEDHGVNHSAFGELLISSGLVLDDDITFVTFHGGYALAYLLKLMTCRDLPQSLDYFVEQIRTYLPHSYDIRYIMQRHNSKFHGGGLDALGAEFGVKREPTLSPHQAGSDAFMALKVFAAMKSAKLISPSYEGWIYALDQTRPKSGPNSPSGGPQSYAGFPGASPTDADSHNTPDRSKGGLGGYATRKN